MGMPCSKQAVRAGLDKSVHPHVPCGNCFATHLLESGTDSTYHSTPAGATPDLKTTSRYLHLSERHLKATQSPARLAYPGGGPEPEKRFPKEVNEGATSWSWPIS